ncbi:LysR family transcriptional regulator, partial [Rhizobium brockwellii]
TAGVKTRSVLDLIKCPTPVQTHQLGPVETLHVYRKNDRPSAINAFHEVLRATKGRDVSLTTN